MPKNILVFLDGTRNKPSDEARRRATNVWKLYQAAAAAQHGHEPLAVYLRGVGTLPEPVKRQPAADLNFRRLRQWLPPAGPAARAARKLLQLPKRIVLRYGAAAVGWGVADRIREGYAYLSEHYRPGDHVYLFGFSRGAFEARSLAGFVDAVGLLLADKATGPDPRRLVDIAYDLYRRGDAASLALLRRFLRRITGRAAPVPGAEVRRLAPVDLHLVGIWDTVAAIGFGDWNEQLPVVRRHTTHHAVARLPACIRHGRHALALHELRHKFEPSPWVGAADGQDIVQCWFAGAHADVGGGYPETHLSDIALDWMAGEAATLSARTASPLRFVGLPPPGPAARAQPHQTIQGDFFWATPTPRTALQSAEGWQALGGELAVHPSAVERLFDPAATDYAHYPFEADLPWAEQLGLGADYPPDAAAALHWIDDRTLARHLQSCERRFGGAAWRQPADVSDLRLLDAMFASEPLDPGHRFAGPFDLAAALTLLLVTGRAATIAHFVQRVATEVDQLVVQAGTSVDAGLKIRDTRWPLFSALCTRTWPAPARLPPALAPLLQSVHANLCASSELLRSQLPLRVPAPAKFVRRKPRG